jgi:hypothetical protein
VAAIIIAATVLVTGSACKKIYMLLNNGVDVTKNKIIK